MAKTKGLKITGIKASTLALFEGTLASVIGLWVAIMYSLNTTIKLAESTNSYLAGLAFGITAGIVSIIVLPFIYFGIGWIIGYIHGYVFNVITASSGGIELTVED